MDLGCEKDTVTAADLIVERRRPAAVQQLHQRQVLDAEFNCVTFNFVMETSSYSYMLWTQVLVHDVLFVNAGELFEELVCDFAHLSVCEMCPDVYQIVQVVSDFEFWQSRDDINVAGRLMHGEERFDATMLHSAHLCNFVLNAPLIALIPRVHLYRLNYLFLLCLIFIAKVALD